MSFLRYLGLVVASVGRQSLRSRRPTLLLVVLVGLVFVALGIAAQVATPFVIYPFI